LKTIAQFNLSEKKVLVRVDFNVPLNADFEISDDSRMTAALPTINKIIADGGIPILMSHLGRPKNGPEEKYSLKHLAHHLAKITGCEVIMADDCIGEKVETQAKALTNNQILLLENLRFYKEETQGNLDFAKKLSLLGDFYVNDAFGTAHRAHASTAVIAQFFQDKKAFGFLMAAEVENAIKVMNNPQRPFTAIVGGAKVSDKLLILENLLNIADNILIGGGMSYTFLKAMGQNIGNSLKEDDRMPLTLELMEKAKQKGVNLYLPEDSIIADAFSSTANTKTTASGNIEEGWMGLDIGPVAQKHYQEVIESSKTVLWNGPMGVFEMEKFENGTKNVAASVAKATENGAFTLIGGGDSAAAIHQFGYADNVSYVSTGGGALLEYFEGKTLPGIAAIEN
jgi:phosphoglycerate kinase